jgi:glycolate oxidase
MFQVERKSELECILAIKKAMDPKNILNPGKAAQWRGTPKRNLRYPCKEYMGTGQD